MNEALVHFEWSQREAHPQVVDCLRQQ